MFRRPVVAVVSLVTAALLMVEVRFLITLGNPREELNEVRAEPDAATADSDASIDVGVARREIVAKQEEPGTETASVPLPTRSRTAIRVHGQVLGGWGPVADYNLSFCTTGGLENKEVDWDFTDQDGRYEVELRAGQYSVFSGEGLPVTTFEVTEDSQVLMLDLYVPTSS